MLTFCKSTRFLNKFYLHTFSQYKHFIYILWFSIFPEAQCIYSTFPISSCITRTLSNNNQKLVHAKSKQKMEAFRKQANQWFGITDTHTFQGKNRIRKEFVLFGIFTILLIIACMHITRWKHVIASVAPKITLLIQLIFVSKWTFLIFLLFRLLPLVFRLYTHTLNTYYYRWNACVYVLERIWK